MSQKSRQKDRAAQRAQPRRASVDCSIMKSPYHIFRPEKRQCPANTSHADPKPRSKFLFLGQIGQVSAQLRDI
jgi:hypothetical protein